MMGVFDSPWLAFWQGLAGISGTWLLAFGLKTVLESGGFDTSEPHLVARRFWVGLTLLTLAVAPSLLGPFVATGRTDDRVTASAPTRREASEFLDNWTYPVGLGDSRSKAHELLGNPSRTTEVLEEYPLSGVTLWFSPEGRVTKLNFQGLAGEIYASQDWILSNRDVIDGLNSQARQSDFLSRLGTPLRRNQSGLEEERLLWRVNGLVVDALFLTADRNEQGRMFPEGSLLWFEISPGL